MRNKSLFKITILFSIFALVSIKSETRAQDISKSFELRYYTPDAKANGITDFKGETEYFDLDKRLEYLKTYEEVAGEFFDNKDWNRLVINDKEAKDIAVKIKPQPLPEVRKRLILDDWKMLGSKPGKEEVEQKQIDWWNQQKGVKVKNGQLYFIESHSVTKKIENQDWRSLISMDIKPALSESNNEISLGDALKINLKNGKVYVSVQGKNTSVAKYNDGEFILIKIETDQEYGKYNLYVDQQKVVDFKPLDKKIPFENITISGSRGTVIDNLYGVKYTKSIFTEIRDSRDVPFSINTFLDENFSITPSIHGWQSAKYDDSQWEIVDIPYAHGGDRFKNESMYLRKIVHIDDFNVANLNFETIDPGGEVWVNGEVVSVVHERTPYKKDISQYLKKNSINTIAVRVYPNKVENTNRHTSADLYTGSFTGRAWIDLHQERYIKDVFVYTKKFDENATLSVNVELQNDDWEFKSREVKKDREFNGFLKIKVFKWFPEEASEPAFEEKHPINLRLKRAVSFSQDIVLNSPDKWHFNNPNLYKVVAIIEDENGNPIDDYVITTGIRTVSQEGGTFRINGEPEMMNGALLFGYKYPLEDIARTIRCADEYWLVKEIMMMKRGNGNTLRMSVHHGYKGGINDPRLAEIGDQLGIMFQWTTGAWVRNGSPWLVDSEALPHYVKQVRNHPSITMWQPANHPRFQNFEEEGTTWLKKIYQAIYPNDPSRLISSTANNSRWVEGAPNDLGTLNGKKETFIADPVWTAPMVTRGNMDHSTGYGAEWSTLRKYPFPPSYIGEMGWREKGYRVDYLNSKDRAYFDFESEESAGQPNWTLRKGKPSYRIKSYELGYDDGSIGRKLTTDEWRLSQAWQGFSGFEAYKKKRWLDYDGLAWCPLHGGGNTSSYQKPLIDYFGYSKIVFHTVKMSFQNILACSKNVDVVYGPDDKVPVTVMNIGKQKSVDVTVTCKNLSGKNIFTKKYKNITLKEGRTVTDLEEIDLSLKKEGYYIFEYQVE